MGIPPQKYEGGPFPTDVAQPGAHDFRFGRAGHSKRKIYFAAKPFLDFSGRRACDHKLSGQILLMVLHQKVNQSDRLIPAAPIPAQQQSDRQQG